MRAASLPRGAEGVGPDGGALANHWKLGVAADATFYRGSQNWYPADLMELGYIVDDVPTTRQLLAGYFTEAWTESARDAVGGLPSCN